MKSRINITPDPSFERIRKTLLLQGKPDRLPLCDFSIEKNLMEWTLGRELHEETYLSAGKEYKRVTPKEELEFWYSAGYDFVCTWPFYDFAVSDVRVKEGSVAAEGYGIIQTMDDLMKKEWPWQNHEHFNYDHVVEMAKILPDNMKLIILAHDIFTYVWENMGFSHFCNSLFEDTDLIEEFFRQMGEAIYVITKRSAEQVGNKIGAIWYADDLAFNTGTFVNLKVYRKYLFPWVKRLSELSRSLDAPFLYHSDGKLWSVFDDFYELGVNAVHPLEPKSMEAEEVKEKQGNRFCLIGNIDVDLLSHENREYVINTAMEKTINCHNPVDLILSNGKFFSRDDNGNVYEAMAICGDKIHALGTAADILALKGNTTKVINLEGKTVIPGLIDTHTHFSSSALTEVRGELFIPTSVKELLDHIRRRASLIRKGEWLYYGGVYLTRLEEHRYPTLQELDEAAPDHPVYISGGYAGQANTCALLLAGINENTRPETGTICTDEKTGKINGRLLSCGYLVKNYIASPSYSEEEVVNAIVMLQKEYNRLGITSVIDAATSSAHLNAYNTLYSQEKLNIRMVYSFMAPKLENVDTEVTAFSDAINTPVEWGKLRFMKVLLDGGILTGTSYMRDPLKDDGGLYGISDSMYRGFIGFTKEKLVRYVQKACDIGLQMTAHCVGDAATDRFVEAYEEINNHNSIVGKRHSIIHATFTDISTLCKIKRLGLTLISQPAWHYKDAAVISRVLEEGVMRSFLPYRDMEVLGVNVSAGSDHMMKHDSFLSQNPYNPYLGLYNLITRKTWDGKVFHPEQKVSRRTALKMYTENGAYTSFDEKSKGTLEVGKLADMAVLSKDFFTISEEELPFIESELTIVGGRIVYKKEKSGEKI